jgi:copper homeostasis protein
LSILNVDGTIDKKRTEELVKLAGPMSFTYVRGFDVCRDPFEAMDDLISIGVDRILTTGQCGYVIDGLDLITELIEKASDKIIIMPGSSTNENVAEVIKRSGAKEVHTYLSDFVEGEMDFRKTGVFMGGDGPMLPEFKFKALQPGAVREFIKSMEK